MAFFQILSLSSSMSRPVRRKLRNLEMKDVVKHYRVLDKFRNSNIQNNFYTTYKELLGTTMIGPQATQNCFRILRATFTIICLSDLSGTPAIQHWFEMLRLNTSFSHVILFVVQPTKVLLRLSSNFSWDTLDTINT